VDEIIRGELIMNHYFRKTNRIHMHIVLFDDNHSGDLQPFTFTRAVADIRCGILTIREKWEKYASTAVSVLTSSYLQPLYSSEASLPVLYINGALLPDSDLMKFAASLAPGQQLRVNGRLLIYCSPVIMEYDFFQQSDFINKEVLYNGTASSIRYSWDIFTLNDQEIRKDFELLTSGKKSASVSSSNQVINPSMVFLEEGAKVECSIINASTGPVYIAADAEVMEGCIIRGPFALGSHGALKMGTRIYGATTIGPGAKVGGEVSNSVIFGNSNKAHDGFLGNSVIGEWCNLGADTNNSNLKNNYGEVSVWNYSVGDYIKTGLQFCGLFMGDHSKCGINTMFNTGTTVGVCANIFGAGFPDKYLPSFTWGGTDESEVFILDKALELAARVMARRGRVLSEADKNILTHLYMEQLKPLPGSED